MVINNVFGLEIYESILEGSTTEKLNSFQVYSTGNFGMFNILVDKIWVKDNRIYFSVQEIISAEKKYLRKEKIPNIYSIHEKDLFSIRCRLYF
ncbi:MAG: hypothetical protein HWN80_09145 [Candidatus Lokiarchaeota archaeon]|nr:hypothetical protein [Candidatus Lokiarchaeota archaeon]